MIYYGEDNIYEWNYGTDNLIKVYRDGYIAYYKMVSGSSSGQTPCFAVVDDINDYSSTEFEDVFDKTTSKWYKLNNLDEFEEYGVYADTTGGTYYDGKLAIVGTTSRLPNGYTEVEYVENTGSSSVNLNLALNESTSNTYEIVFDNTMEWTSGGEDYQTFLCCKSELGTYPGWYYRFNNSGQLTNSNWISLNRTASGSAYHNVITVTSVAANQTSDYPLNLFSALDTSKAPFRYCKGRLYNMQVTLNNSLVRNLVPCKRNSDNEYGLYDLVNDVFYASATNAKLSGGTALPTNADEYEYSGGTWVNVGAVSGTSKTSGFVSGDVATTATEPSNFTEGRYVLTLFDEPNHYSPTDPTYMISYLGSGGYNYLNNFSGHNGSSVITDETILDAAVWEFESTSSANTYYIKNLETKEYFGYQSRNSNVSMYLVSEENKIPVKIDLLTKQATMVEFPTLREQYSNVTSCGGYSLNDLYNYHNRFNWWGEGCEYGGYGNGVEFYKVSGGSGEITYPVYYAEKQAPPIVVDFQTVAEMEAYECPYVGLIGYVGGDRYVFNSNYEWVSNQQVPCYAVADDISQYSSTEFEDVFDKTTSKWYKLNNLDEFEEYGIYGEGRNITHYDGKLTIDSGYEYIYSGSSWVSLGEVTGTSASLPSVAFSFNYNASEYDSTNHKFPKTNNQTVDVDAVLGGTYALTAHTDDGYVSYSGSSASAGAIITGYQQYINRISNSGSCEMTIVSKQLTNGSSCHLLANRYSDYNWMYRVYNSKLTLHGSRETGQIGVSSSQPNVVSCRVKYDDGVKVWYNNWTQQTSTSPQSFSYGSVNNYGFAIFNGYAGNQSGENYAGDFYWIYMTPNTLTDEQVQQVIDYNEGGGSEYPLYYEEKQNPPSEVTFATMDEALAYECPYVGLEATIGGDPYVFNAQYQWAPVT